MDDAAAGPAVNNVEAMMGATKATHLHRRMRRATLSV
jgi:hypothetical protein